MHVSRTLVSKQDPFRSAAPITFSMRHAYQPGLGGEVWLGFRLVGGAEVSINKNVVL